MRGEFERCRTRLFLPAKLLDRLRIQVKLHQKMSHTWLLEVSANVGAVGCREKRQLLKRAQTIASCSLSLVSSRNWRITQIPEVLDGYILSKASKLAAYRLLDLVFQRFCNPVSSWSRSISHNQPWRSQPMRRISFGLFTSSVLGVFLISLCATGAFGQGTTTGTLNGAVKDQNGAVVAGANVTVRNEATGTERKATSGDDGVFVVDQVPPGSYSIIVEGQGFKRTVAPKIIVELSQTATVNITLELGSVSETV